MNKLIIISLVSSLFATSACKKKPTTDASTTTEAQVLSDFANVLANPNYVDLQTKANTLNIAIQTLNTTTTDANLQAAQVAWRNTRTVWESAEGYLFGPVEDFNYDPSIDTWPLDKTELDSLLSSSNTLTVANIDSLPFSLKGFHAIEYMLFGTGNNRKASDLSQRDKTYLASLTQSLYNTTTSLVNSWAANQGNFMAQVINAGNGGTRYTTRKAAFLAIVSAMSGICNEVANEKMQDPLVAQDSTLDESGFSHNSTADFTHNIQGVLNAYLCKYTSQGHSLHDLVYATNISLDNTIQTELNNAVSSFSNINSNYEKAIYTQQVQIHNTQNAINALKATLDGDLTTFIQITIKD